MKRFATLSFTLILALSFLSTAFAQDEDVTIGLVTINLQALFFNQINDGATQAAEEAGATLNIVDARNDPSRQVDAIETFITQGVDAIIVVAIDVEGILPAVQSARDADIPVVAIDARIEVPPANTFIGVDNVGAGEEAGNYTLEFINTEMDGSAQIGVVGALNSFIQNQRRDGFVSVVEGAEGVELVGTVDGQNVQETALSAAENLVTGNPDLDIIYATGEPALIGAIAAVESQGVQDSVTIIGWDLSEQAIRGIDEGFVQAVVQQDPFQEGVRAVEASLSILNGEEVSEEILIPITIVTQENVDEYRSLFE